MNNALDEIISMMRDHDISFIDACIEFCERNNIRIDEIAVKIRQSSSIKKLIEEEASALNLLKKEEEDADQKIPGIEEFL